MDYLIFFLASFIFTVILTIIVKRLAWQWGILDVPDKQRKNHKNPTPLLGGLAVFFAFFAILFFAGEKITSGNLSVGHWLGFFIGACFLMIGGFLDDKYNFKSWQQIICPILAVIAVLLGGVEIQKITNPLGGFFYFSALISGAVIFIWLLLMMYTTKLLDGVDGLVGGVSAIGGLVIFLFTITTKYHQPDIALAALIFSGACLGFLVFNWHPAKIFLGEGGSLFLGYVLGVFAIISGGKIAITFLVLGLPLLDVAWTIIRRAVSGKNPFKNPDRRHLHHLLLSRGLSPRQTVVVFYSVSLLFGLSALFLQSLGKIVAVSFLILIMLAIVILSSLLGERNKNN